MIRFWVFDVNFNRLGSIDIYSRAQLDRYFYEHSVLNIVLGADEEKRKLLITDDIRIIVPEDDLQRGYIVELPKYQDEKSATIEIVGYSLSYMLSWRIIKGQQRFTGTIEDVLRSFVNSNAISTTQERIIPNLVLGPTVGITTTADEAYSNEQLDETLWEMCKKYEVSYEILMNHELKKYEFVLVKGTDRSAQQIVVDPIIFSKTFKNVLTQSFTDDRRNYKNTAYVAGEGEGEERTVVEVGTATGFDRREVFVDARDLQSEYTDESDNTITISPAEYKKILEERGQNKLSEHERIKSFESEPDTKTYRFGVDYQLGDIITNRNDDINIISHQRVIAAHFDYVKDELTLEFGSSVPTPFQNLKKR